MGLLDRIATADGGSSAPYLKGGRHVGRLRRMELRDPSKLTGAAADLKPGFKADIEVLFSNSPSFGSETEGAFRKGDVGRVTDPFRYPSSTLAKVRRLLVAALRATSDNPEEITEGRLDLKEIEGESDKDFQVRYAARAEELLGPNQPLNGAIVTFVVTEGINKQTNKPYSLFEAFEPSEDDLKNAGLLD